jgi:hypothetical protein
MRFLALVLITLMTFNTIANAFVEVCHSSSTSCKSSSYDKCSEKELTTVNKSTSENKTSSPGSSSEHCRFHCAHQCLVFIVTPVVISIASLDVSTVQTYEFELLKTYLEGPFRPPLS